MRKSLAILLFSAAAAFNAGASTEWNVQGRKFNVDTLSHVEIGPGTTQTTLALSGPADLRLFYTTTDLTNPNVGLKVIMGKDNLTSNVTVPDMPGSHTDPANVYFAGVNSDFIGGMGPVGTTASNGILYKTYKNHGWYAFGVDANKKMYSGNTYSSLIFTCADGSRSVIHAVNVPRSDNEMILYTSKKGSSTGTGKNGVEIAAVAVDGGLKSDGATKMKITGAPVENVGNMQIPANGFVLSASGWIVKNLKKLKAGDIIEVTPTIRINDEIVIPEEVTGGCPMLLKDGSILETQGELDHLKDLHPRTAAGYSADGTKVVMLVVDGRQPGVSVGVASKDLAAIMKNLGCADAINFDGGGSSTLYVKELGVVNTPSEGGLRRVKDGLFLTAPATSDNKIAKIRFADYKKVLKSNGYYTPVIYGYNSQGLLVNINVNGFQLSCDKSLGEIQPDGVTLFGNGSGCHMLTATYQGLTASIAVTVGEQHGGVSEVVNDGISVYPNPAKQGENIHITAVNDNSQVRIYNAAGVQVYSGVVGNGGKSGVEVDTKDFVPGFYIIKILCNFKEKTTKIIIH